MVYSDDGDHSIRGDSERIITPRAQELQVSFTALRTPSHNNAFPITVTPPKMTSNAFAHHSTTLPMINFDSWLQN